MTGTTRGGKKFVQAFNEQIKEDRRRLREANQDGRSIDIPNPMSPLIFGGGITLLIGASHSGKTTYLAGIVWRVMNGLSVVGLMAAYEIPAIGIIITDRGWKLAQEWFERAGVEFEPNTGKGLGRSKCGKIRLYTMVDDYSPDLFRRLKPDDKGELFGEHIDALGLPEGSLLIVDSIATYLPARMNDYATTATGIMALRREIQNRKLSCVGTLHTPKVRVDDGKGKVLKAHEKALGSVALGAYTDAQIVISSPDETGMPGVTQVDLLSHTAPNSTWQYRRLENGTFDDGQLVEGAIGGEKETAAMSPAKTERMMAMLEHVPADDTVDRQTLMNDAGIGLALVKKYLSELIKLGLVERVRAGAYRKAAQVVVGEEN